MLGIKGGSKIAKRESLEKFYKLRTIKSDMERVSTSAEDGQRVSKALCGALVGFVVGGLLYFALVFSYDYSYPVAGIIAGVATVFFILCLAFCPLCRCIMALVFPNFFTGRGRVVFLSIIFGVMLSHPIANIRFNIEEVGKSLACVTELAANQTRALQKQLAKPVAEVASYVEKEKDKLEEISCTIESSFNEIKIALDELHNKIEDAKNAVLTIKEVIIKRIHCRDAVEEGIKYFKVDVEVSSKIEGSVNDSNSFEGIQEKVKKEVGHVFLSFEKAVFVFKVIFSLSLGLIFVQSFWYLRNYLAKDAFDNIYITSQFKKMDKENTEKGTEGILPLRKKERSVYVDTSSFRLNVTELVHCRFGLAQVFLHFIVCMMVVLFDYSLSFILKLIENNVNNQIEVEGEGRFTVEVKGEGPVAEFYRIIVPGFNLNHTYSSNLDVRNCLPRPTQPSAAVLLSFVVLYLIALVFVVLRGYGMRLRRKIAAYYYPEQELMRLEYLHKKIRHKRIGFLKFLRHQIKSVQKENVVNKKFCISTWLAFKFPALERFCLSRDTLECTICTQKESGFHGIVLTNCLGQMGEMPCDAVFCEECRSALNNVCPLCAQDAVVLRP